MPEDRYISRHLSVWTPGGPSHEVWDQRTKLQLCTGSSRQCDDLARVLTEQGRADVPGDYRMIPDALCGGETVTIYYRTLNESCEPNDIEVYGLMDRFGEWVTQTTETRNEAHAIALKHVG